MTLTLEDLPDDVAALEALLLAERAPSDRLRHLLSQLRRAHFGRKSEKIDADQMNFGLEDLETAVAVEQAKLEKPDAVLRAANTRKRRANRGHLPAHLPREEIVRGSPLIVRHCATGSASPLPNSSRCMRA